MFGDCAGFIPSCIGTIALILSMLASFWCKSFKFTPIVDLPNIDGDPDIHMSPWFQQTTTINTASTNGELYIWSESYCVKFLVPPQLDGYWKASQAFSILAATFGGLGTIALYFSCCFPQHFTTDTWRSLALKFSVMVTISQGLTLLIFKSTACTDNNIIRSLEETLGGLNIYNNTCEWDKGSSMNVSALLLWFATGVSMILIGPPRRTGAASSRHSKKKKSKSKKKSTATSAKDDKDAEEAGATPEAVTTE